MADEWCGVGYRMIHDRLRNEGLQVNHKRVLRLWRELRLDRRTKPRRRRANSRKTVPSLPAAQSANERWAIDFLLDRLENGQPYRIIAVIDVHTRECVAIEAARSMPSWRVIAVLERTASIRGVPQMITSDNGPELTSHAVRDWAGRNAVTIRYSRVHTPTDNPFIESFNARLRAECADLWWTTSIKEANQLLADWRRRYNEQRPHRSIGRIPPSRYARTVPWIVYKAPVVTTAVPS
jgi:putative transposase